MTNIDEAYGFCVPGQSRLFVQVAETDIFPEGVGDFALEQGGGNDQLAEYGITLADLVSAKAAKSRKAVAAKYRNPANGDSWSGRGRVPKWLVALEGAGRKREEFAVK